jgi:hypothetical protein
VSKARADARMLVLLDTNPYLRLAKRVRPLIGEAFGQGGYVLTVLSKVEDEVHRSPKLRFRQPAWCRTLWCGRFMRPWSQMGTCLLRGAQQNKRLLGECSRPNSEPLVCPMTCVAPKFRYIPIAEGE